MNKSAYNGNGHSFSNGNGAIGGPVEIIITGARLNEQHQLLNP